MYNDQEKSNLEVSHLHVYTCSAVTNNTHMAQLSERMDFRRKYNSYDLRSHDNNNNSIIIHI